MAGTEGTISARELERRVAVLRRFRELLRSQRDHFRQYLEVLDKQQDVIKNGDADALIAHVELEEKIVSDIFAVQKVIDPLEAMYAAQFGAEGPAAGAEAREVPGLKAALEELKAEALIRSGRNRALLDRRMAEIRQEMKTLRSKPYAIHRSAFSTDAPALIDING
ncbi:MAG: flagellar protein FlgN [Treponema sp.]|nr:flagellar protein FlgN [Treponema sp.]